MKTTIYAILLFLSTFCMQAKEVVSTWIYVPSKADTDGDPWRIVMYSDDSISSETFYFGCKRDFGIAKKLPMGDIEIREGDKLFLVNFAKDHYEFTQTIDGKDNTIILIQDSDWNLRFEKAPYAPKNRAEALQVLDIILSEEDKNSIKEMKEGELIRLHFGFGMGLRNGFGLWSPGSQIVKDYGGGHPDDVSMKLITEYWAILQTKK